MGKRSIAKLLLALFVICVQTGTSQQDTELLHKAHADQVDYLWQARRWSDMTWFDEITGVPIDQYTEKDLSKDDLWTKPLSISDNYKLKIIVLIMKCGYGKKLIDFLWTTMLTTIECRDWAKHDRNTAKDCWSKLGNNLVEAAVAMFKLTRMYAQIDSVSTLDIADFHSFYGTILRLHDFFNQQHTEVTKGLTDNEYEYYYEHIHAYARALELSCSANCKPVQYTVSRREFLSQYEHKPRHRDEIVYEVYVAELHSFVNFIKAHSENIGFRFTTDRKDVDFSISSSSSRE